MDFDIMQDTQINRRSSTPVIVGGVGIGGEHRVTVQSMTNTRTSDVQATIAQIINLEAAGCDIIRVAVPDSESASALREIKSGINIPLVADIHFDYRLAITAAESGVDKLRINPGNIGSVDRVKEVVAAAKDHGIPIRIGVNAGSIDRARYGLPSAQALVESALDEAGVLESCGFSDIVLSLKASDVPTMIQAYKLVAQRCEYPLHLGVTEAGLAWEGTIRSSIGIGALLAEGVGDTIRVSLTGDSVEEIRVGREILSSLSLRLAPYTLVSCPTCGRCGIDLAGAAQRVRDYLEANPPARPLSVAVMGCVVNGPGEASSADVGIAGGAGVGALFVKGVMVRKVKEDDLVSELIKEIEKIGADS
jgi:(E)-4-hydroxy-3-methylbut-2-enyl-diphosphate synthase